MVSSAELDSKKLAEHERAAMTTSIDTLQDAHPAASGPTGRQNPRPRPAAGLEATTHAVWVADFAPLTDAMSGVRWRRRGLLQQLVREEAP
jgi:hypothetical protein